ncbi:histidine kinase [Alicyclobacillus contaminans]|uniref:sensor histidine kinase n=1 Tax=Alicyclobacillus contaminans TaxID=392016 RepID=UPI000421981B|nr:ATP-binding protein [Alicyclobacillus contaminans]GMA51289.1 histidine kinase [Alicyclobacillus contaminans]
MKDRIAALQGAIQSTLTVIQESRDQVEEIVQSAMDEVKQLEAEYAEVSNACMEAIERVELLSQLTQHARQRLMEVSRDIHTFNEQSMKSAYERAEHLQTELARWREREAQLRIRRDSIARRLRALRATAQQAEVLLAKFEHAAAYLGTEFGDLGSVLESANQYRLLGLQMLQLMEEERRHLAAELHDGPMQALATLAMRISGPLPDGEESVMASINQVIASLRQVVFDLRPSLIDDLGLVPTLKQYAAQWSKLTGIAEQVRLVGLEVKLSPTEKVTVFRCVQELLKNVRQHSGAQRVTLEVVYGESVLQVVVADDGRGFHKVDWAEWLEQGKLGMTLCRQRMTALGGDVEIQDSVPAGARVVLTLPIQRRSESQK